MSLSRNRHGVWVQTRQHAIKEKIKIATHDWVDHQICSLLQYIIVRINLNLVKIIQKKKNHFPMNLERPRVDMALPRVLKLSLRQIPLDNHNWL